jgi:hypothetical protein
VDVLQVVHAVWQPVTTAATMESIVRKRLGPPHCPVLDPAVGSFLGVRDLSPASRCLQAETVPDGTFDARAGRDAFLQARGTETGAENDWLPCGYSGQSLCTPGPYWLLPDLLSTSQRVFEGIGTGSGDGVVVYPYPVTQIDGAFGLSRCDLVGEGHRGGQMYLYLFVAHAVACSPSPLDDRPTFCRACLPENSTADLAEDD